MGTLSPSGTLSFVAGASGFSSIREARTGRYGLEDLGSGVTGQPVDPDVVSTVVLGGDLEVDVTGPGTGTYSLIDVDSLSRSLASITAAGGSGTVTNDVSNGLVSISVG